MLLIRVLGQLLAIVCLSLPTLLAAQSPPPRLHGEIRGDARSRLPGSSVPFTLAEAVPDLGPVPVTTPMHGITITLKRTPEQELELQALLAAQLDPASPHFHQWLTPDDFQARFGVAVSDLALLQSWLRHQGFQVDSPTGSRDRIDFSGTAAQVAAAFGTSLHTYRTPGGERIAPAGDLHIPTELLPLVGAILHLSNGRPEPPLGTAHSASASTPAYTTSTGQLHYLDPLDLAVEYDLQPLYSARVRGVGQSIAVVGQSAISAVDSGNFGIALGLGSLPSPGMVLVPNSGVKAQVYGDQAESDLDVEYSEAIAPGATIFLIFTGNNPTYNVFDALRYAVTSDVAPIISVSYSACELGLSTSEFNNLSAIAQQASAQGQTIVAAAGDDGSAGCFRDTDLSTAQREGLATPVPASLANVTAVGGLQMAAGTFAANSSTYFAPASGSDAVASLLSYVPEVIWNEPTSTTNIAAGGGGTSALVPRPTWQAGVPGIPAGSFRLLPDLALQASTRSPGYVFCSSDPAALRSGQVNSCYNGTLVGQPNNLPLVDGGTSFAAPVFAGMVALLNEATRNPAQGNINPVLYALASNPGNYATAFHDITSGGNECTLGSSSCSAAAQTSYMATQGYDEASGLGSVDLAKMVSVWPATPASALTPTTTLVGLASFTAGAGSVQLASVSVNDSNYDAVSGTLRILLDGEVVQSALPITYSESQFNFTAPASTGSHLLTVAYSGDATHGPSIGSIAFDVGTLTATGTFTIAGSNVNVPANGSGTGSLTVTPGNGYNGRVNFSLGASSSPVALCYSLGQGSVYAGTPATISYNLAAGTACTGGAVSGLVRVGPVSAATGPKLGPLASAASESALPFSVSCAGLLLCSLGIGRRRKCPVLLLHLLLLGGCLGLVACGGGAKGGGGTTGPGPVSSGPQVVVITVTGHDSVAYNISNSSTFTVTVGQ